MYIYLTIFALVVRDVRVGASKRPDDTGARGHHQPREETKLPCVDDEDGHSEGYGTMSVVSSQVK